MDEPDNKLTPVLFRVERNSKAPDVDVTAVFPCDPASYDGDSMVCFAHVGQHAGASFAWYHTTRAATEAEYAGLKRELESAPYNYRLQVFKRMSSGLRERFKIALRAQR